MNINLEFPPLYAKQHEAIFNDARYAIIEASTKSGKTIGCIVWLIDQATVIGQKGRHFWWVAPVYAQTDIAFRRIKDMFREADPDQQWWQSNEAKLTITLPNGATLWFKSADKPDTLYGEDVYAVVIDEATRCKQEAWYALRSTLTATRGKARIIGNVKGRKNWVYRMARRAESGEVGYHYARLTAYDASGAGVLSEEEVEDAKRTLPANVFKELYLAQPSEDEGNPFGIEAIRLCVSDCGHAQPIAWGLDLAKSVNWTVAIGLDDQGHVVGFQRWQSDWRNTIRRAQGMIGHTPALVDSTGVGDSIVEGLQVKCSAVEGYKFSLNSKQQLMEGLASAIQQQRVRFPDGPIVAELEAFEYEYTRTGVRYVAPTGMHDDCVDALALAVRCRESRTSAMALSIVGFGDDRIRPGDKAYSAVMDDELWDDI